MKEKRRLLLFALLTTILCCIANCNFAYAQSIQQPQIEVVERLNDGTMILTIDGTKYRALNVEHLRKIQEMAVNFKSCVEENGALTAQIEKLKLLAQKQQQDSALANEQANLERRRADEFKKLFEDERALRLQAEKLPRRKNIFEKILSHPVTQVVAVAAAGVIAAKQQ